MKIVSITPALNEDPNIGSVVSRLLSTKLNGQGIAEIIVVDNGSTDDTASVARSNGACVVLEAERGYGAACLRGIQEASDADVLLFIDGDGSDTPEEWPSIVSPIIEGRADLVVGSRSRGTRESGALHSHQRFGNILSSFLLRIFYGTTVSDLGPFRAIRMSVYKDIQMSDRDYGWTVEMQARVLNRGHRYLEVPVSYRKRPAGVSKISGNLYASFLAGKKILWVIFRERFLQKNRE